MGLSKFELHAEPGAGRIVVDGVEVKATRVVIDAEGGPGAVPVVTIEAPAGTVDAEGLGIVRLVEPPTPADVMAVAAEWLEGLDPTTVRAAIEDQPQTLRGDPVAIIIKTLAAAAREASGV